jgi:N-acetylglucosaminyldiphosphoundecaprenol N-acetyl-beta-D-mannosaminyltransferase
MSDAATVFPVSADHAVAEQSDLRLLSTLGYRFHLLSKDELLDLMFEDRPPGHKITIASANLHGLYMFERHREYRELHARQTTLVHVDGMPIVWLLRAFGHDVDRRYRTAWLDWFEVALGRAADSGRRIFVLGHSVDTLNTGLERARCRWPGFEIDGADGYFDVDDAAACGAKVATINSFAPDILFVGMGMPKQEIFAARYRDEIAAPVVGLGGAAFAQFAGDQAAPPRWMGPACLEWAYRLAKDPRRLAGRYTVEPVLLAAALTARLVRGG